MTGIVGTRYALWKLVLHITVVWRLVYMYVLLWHGHWVCVAVAT